MAEFLNTSKAYAEIEGIVSKTKSKLVLISPFIRVPDHLLERLKYMDGKCVKIVVVCRKKDLKDEVRSDLKQLQNLELRFDENLHAKCFYNEESMVITSLNLYESQQHKHNREMGVLLSLKDDSNVFNEACAEAEFIVNNAEKDSLLRNVLSGMVRRGESLVNSLVQDEPGHCIKCGKDITPYNKDLPFCRDCWKPGVKLGRFCYKCGEEKQTTKEKPLCNSCYRKPRKGN